MEWLIGGLSGCVLAVGAGVAALWARLLVVQAQHDDCRAELAAVRTRLTIAQAELARDLADARLAIEGLRAEVATLRERPP